MADVALARRGPLDGVSLASSADRAVSIATLPPRARFIVRGGSDVADAASGALGFALPTTACRAESAGDVVALWLAPDEWLVIGPDVAHQALSEALSEAFGSMPHSLVDVSHRNAALLVSGPKATFVLAHGCPLDLDLRAFPVGMCTRTIVGRTEAVLWRQDEDVFHVEVWRSFMAYLVGFLDEARREFTA
jgi:sarcosine oxidase, subunit gamma